jgi:hypothetical protein
VSELIFFFLKEKRVSYSIFKKLVNFCVNDSISHVYCHVIEQKKKKKIHLLIVNLAIIKKLCY